MLAPSSDATVLKVRGGKALTSRGPFDQTAGVICGFDFLDVDDLDEAIEIASRHPMARNVRLEPLVLVVYSAVDAVLSFRRSKATSRRAVRLA